MLASQAIDIVKGQLYNTRMDKFRELLRAEMLERGLSGRKLAREIGIGYVIVHEFLAEKRSIRRGTQALICEHLGLDWDWRQSPTLSTPTPQEHV